MSAWKHSIGRGLGRSLLGTTALLAVVSCGGSDEPARSPQQGRQSEALAAPMAARTEAAAQPWKAYMLAPSSRTLAPVAVYKTNGQVDGPTNVLNGGVSRISSRGSYLTLDFGKEVGGVVTLQFAGTSSAGRSLGLAFTESTDFVGTVSDTSNWSEGEGSDGAIFASIGTAGASSYTMPLNKLRGGFRYLTLFLDSDGWVDLSGVSLNFTAAPLMKNPADYPNHFYSNDDLLNKLWYAGAYTVQMSTMDPTQGRVMVGSGWDNSALIGPGKSVLADGAKRDRTVWPGDMGIAVPVAYVSTGDTVSSKNSLQQMFDMQQGSGELPFAGPPVNAFSSDTYHLWTLVGTYNYYIYSGKKAWLNSIWPKYKAGVEFALGKKNGPHGLMNVTGTLDWKRVGQGGENIAANALLYHVLDTGAAMATDLGDSTAASRFSGQAADLKTRINSTLWDADQGAYRDNPDSRVFPQDGNSLAVWYGAVDSTDKATRVASYLKSNINAFGALTPELNGAGNGISTFAGSMQLMAMLKASSDVEALDLMRREWGHMYNHPKGTKTFWEGMSFGGEGDGSGYRPWYLSYAHGWAAGPTAALTFYTLGVHPTAPTGQRYEVIPHPGDLTHAEGRLKVDKDKFIDNRYDRAADGGFTMVVDSTTNLNSKGVIGIPKFGASRSITIDGVAVWNGSSFLGAKGIASADQDANYVYFRDVKPGLRSFAYAGNGTTWTTCANENGTCNLNGTRGVRYGSGSTFVYGSFTGSVACSNAVFGDPVPQTVKRCEVSDTALPPSHGAWVLCASENQRCAFTNSQTVAFGAAGAFNMARKTGGADCNSATFGDPKPGVAKQCWRSLRPDNAGFEAPAVNGFQYNPPNASWQFTPSGTDSGSGIQSNNSAFAALWSPEGKQTAFVQRDGSVTQTLTDVPRGTYAVAFRAARRTSFGERQSLKVLVDGNDLGTVSPGSSVFGHFVSNPIALGAGNHTLSIVGQNTGQDATDFVDAVSLVAH